MIHQLYVIGFNHHVFDAIMRGKIAMNPEKQDIFYQKILSLENQSVCVLNTCNRTEIYGFGDKNLSLQYFLETIDFKPENIQELIDLQGSEALHHILRVACGLDSQIVGDLEILGQFKQAFAQAKQLNTLNGYLERVANTAIQAAKEVRSSTNISSGTVSLAYACVKYIKNKYQQKPIKILSIGTGKFGKSIAYNIKDYLPNATLILTNRTKSKAIEIAGEINCAVCDFEEMYDQIADCDVIISSVDDTKNQYLLNAKNVKMTDTSKLFIDMSVPLSIDPQLGQNEFYDIVSMDQVSSEVKDTVESRKENIPIAYQILEKHLEDFKIWSKVYEKSYSIQEWKNTIIGLSQKCPHLQLLPEEQRTKIVNQSVNDFITYLKENSNILPKDSKAIIYHFLTESDKKNFYMKLDPTLIEKYQTTKFSCQES